MISFISFAVHAEEQREIESRKPKVYSKQMIIDFEQKRKQAKEQEERQFLKEFFNYPDEFIQIQDELPPSLRLMDPNLLKKIVAEQKE